MVDVGVGGQGERGGGGQVGESHGADGEDGGCILEISCIFRNRWRDFFTTRLVSFSFWIEWIQVQRYVSMEMYGGLPHQLSHKVHVQVP